MLMRVKLYSNPRQSLVIPEEAIITTGQEHTVMVIQNGEEKTVQKQPVTLGIRRQGEVEIIDGLEEGQQVVTHGTLRVRPGAVVTVKAVETDNESLTELLNQNQQSSSDKDSE
jgi:membrane fusion protein (multidrug efflux system)